MRLIKIAAPVIAGPFAAYAFLRSFWWIAGADWDAEFGAFMSLLCGLIIGVFISVALDLEDRE